MSIRAEKLSTVHGTAGPSYGWVIVAIVTTATALVLGARFSTGMFLPFLPESFDTSAASISAAVALSMLVAAAVQPLIGIMLDRFGGKLVVSIGLACAGLALCMTALANAFWQVVLLMGLVTSIGYAALSPVSATTIVSAWFDKNRGTALGVATSGTKAAMIGLPWAIAALMVLYDWRVAMFAVGAAILALVPAVLLFLRPEPGVRAGRRSEPAKETAEQRPAVADSTVRQALARPAFWMVAVSLFANGLTMNLVFLHLPSYVLIRGFDAAFAATGLALLGAIGIFGTIVTGWLSDHLGRRSVLLIMFSARALATLMVLLFPTALSFAAFVLVFGLLGYGAIGVIGSLATNLFGRSAIGTILSLAYVFNQLGGAVGTFAGGASLAWTGGFDAALWLAIITTALAIPGIALLAREK